MATIIERIGKTGKPSYRVQIRHHSKFLKTMNTNHTLGKTFRTREEARAWADAQEQESKALTSSSSNAPKIIHISERQAFGVLTDFSTPLLANTSSLPFSRIIERYEREIQPHKAAKTQSGQTYLLNYWKKQLGNIPLNKITTALLATEKDRLFQLGIQGPTVRRYLITLHNVLQVAMKQWQLLSSNPATALQKPPDSKGRTRFLSHKEINVLLAKCKANHHYQLYPIVVIALSTGARYKEILTLPFKHIDFERNMMTLKNTKNGEDRSIPLSPFAMDVIRDYLKELAKIYTTLDPETCLLFPSQTLTTPPYIKKAWRHVLHECRIHDFRFHDLRHTFASHLIMSGASLVEAATVLGHKTLAMVRRYAHLSENHTRSIVEQMNSNIFAGMN